MKVSLFPFPPGHRPPSHTNCRARTPRRSRQYPSWRADPRATGHGYVSLRVPSMPVHTHARSHLSLSDPSM
eukprot:357353-Chlamydomonas_euryale.AAC.3